MSEWTALDARLAENDRNSSEKMQLVELIKTSLLRPKSEAPATKYMAFLAASDGETVCLEHNLARPHLWFGERHGQQLAAAGHEVDRKRSGEGRHSALNTAAGFGERDAYGLKSPTIDSARAALDMLGLLGEGRLDRAVVGRWIAKLRAHFPGLTSFGADPDFDTKEIHYKQEVSAELLQSFKAATAPSDWTNAFYKAFRDYHLLHFTIPAKLREDWPKERVGRAIEAIYSAQPGQLIPAMGQLVAAWMADVPDAMLDHARQMAGAIAMHCHPSEAIYFRKTVRDALYLEATKRPFPESEVPEEIFTEELKFARAVEAAFRERDLRPRSLLDVQSALWAIHKYPDAEADPSSDAKSRTMPKPLNTILYGPPGTGKTYLTAKRAVEICDGIVHKDEEDVRIRYAELVSQKRIEFVTFHQSYGYEEFVEGLRPRTPRDGVGFSLEPVDGVLKRIAKRAAEADVEDGRRLPYVLVIDEINRANISKVLGELITLLEEDKRKGATNEIEVVLPHSHEPFSLPSNLHLIGTMNTADRSIALLDTALRRRFHFEEIAPDPSILASVQLEDIDVDLPKVLKAMNERLEFLLGPDHLIGHAWFMGISDKAGLDAVMARKVIPLLREYFHEDLGRVRAVLGGRDGFLEATPLKPPPGLDADFPDPRRRYADRFVSDGAYPTEAYREILGEVIGDQ